MKAAFLNSIDGYHSLKDTAFNKIQSPIIVLMYHRVLPNNKANSSLVVSSSNFKDQINYLNENYTLLKFDSNWQKAEKPRFIITFDDGYYDNYVIARDFLTKKSIPSTFFI